MGAHKNSFANRIRTAAKKLGNNGKQFTAKQLSVEACLLTRDEEKKMSSVVSDLVKAGEMQRVDRGVYLYLGKPGKKELPLKDQMRNLLKIKGSVTLEELQELGAAENYAKEWLQMLARRGVVVKHANGRHELIADMTIPENDEKAERLRRLRAKKKKAIASALDTANAALEKARLELNGL